MWIKIYGIVSGEILKSLYKSIAINLNFLGATTGLLFK